MGRLEQSNPTVELLDVSSGANLDPTQLLYVKLLKLILATQ